MIRVWLDADSCPAPVRNVIIRAVKRENLLCTFVANRPIPLPGDAPVEMLVVPSREGAADDLIAAGIAPGDLAVTRDIPLAARLLERDAVVMNDRGILFTRETIRERLSVRDFMYELRFTGIVDPGNRQFGPKEVQNFANCFDRELRKLLKAREA